MKKGGAFVPNGGCSFGGEDDSAQNSHEKTKTYEQSNGDMAEEKKPQQNVGVESAPVPAFDPLRQFPGEIGIGPISRNRADTASARSRPVQIY